MRSRKRNVWGRLGFAAALVAVAVGVAFSQERHPALSSFAYDFDFESGSVGAWSSYPPAQDTAYDPTILVKRLEGHHGLALVREVRLNYPIDYLFGFRKKLRLLIDTQSRLRFSYFVKNYGKTDALVVKLALAGGLSKEMRIPAGENLSWHEADIPLGAFVPSGASTALHALAIMADCLKADPEAGLALAIDDVRIGGWRPTPVSIIEPRSHGLEELSVNVAGRHFREGEAIDFRVVLPDSAAGGFVRVARVLPNGEPLELPLSRAGKTFTARVPGDRLAAGLWRAEFFPRRDRTVDDETPLYFLVRAKRAPAAHPCLFLTAAEKTRLLDLVGRPGRARDVWTALRESAGSYRKKYRPADFSYNLDAYDEAFWLPTYGGYANTIRTISGYARANAFVYALGGDREAGLAAREALLKIAAWPTLVHPHILGLGQFTYWPVGLAYMDLAAAYDEVYDLLSPAERQAVAASLLHKGIIPVFNEYVRDDRVSSDTSNWISHVTGGGILSALAVSGEVKEEDLEPYLTGMIIKLNRLVESTFDRDGDYGEGYGYHNFTMQTLSEITCVLAEHFGVAWPEKVLRSHFYLPYQMNADSRRIDDFGDTGSKLLPLSNFAYILRLTRDPLLAWLDSLAPGASEADLEFGDRGIHPEPPAGRLPPVKLFRDVGTAVFRSGFGPDDFAFIFRAGPFYNHQHFDQGAFYLADRGRDFLVEGGRTDYYDDPWYQAFFIQPGAHNCLLVDENVESQRAGDLLCDVPAWHDFARITDFLDFKDGAFLSAELAPIYKGRFQTLTRTVLYLKPRTIVLIDAGAGASGASRLDLRFHAPLRDDIGLSGDTATITRGGVPLLLRTLYPQKYEASVLKRPLSLDEFKAENPLTMKPRGFLQLACDVGESGAQVVNVMGTDRTLVGAARLRDAGNHLELEAAGSVTLVRKVSLRGGFDAGADFVDADLFSESEGSIRALRAVEIRTGGRVVFRADSPVTLALEKTGGNSAVVVWAARETAVSLACPARPRRVTLNGSPAGRWSWTPGFLRLDLPGGSSSIEISTH